MTSLPFFKYQVAGNDFIILDPTAVPLDIDKGQLSRALCTRHFSIGADQLLLVSIGDAGCVILEIWNPDGTPSPFCGNACLAVAHYCAAQLSGPNQLDLLISGKLFSVTAQHDQWSLKLPLPEDNYPLTQYSNGADYHHFIRNGTVHRIIVADGYDGIDFATKGEAWSLATDAPEQTNVMFVHSVKRHEFSLTPWERGGTGLSKACASGASSAAWVLYQAGLTQSRVTVLCPGGSLHVTVDNDSISVEGLPFHVCSGHVHYEASP